MKPRLILAALVALLSTAIIGSVNASETRKPTDKVKATVTNDGAVDTTKPSDKADPAAVKDGVVDAKPTDKVDPKSDAANPAAPNSDAGKAKPAVPKSGAGKAKPAAPKSGAGKANPAAPKSDAGKADPAASQNGAGNASVVIGNQRYVPAFIGVVNETYVTYRWIIDPRTGRIITVPVVLQRSFPVQVYYDRVTNVYFYLNAFGQPVPYFGLRPF